MITEKELHDVFDNTAARLDCFTEYDADQIAQKLIDELIKALRRDHRWSAISRLELELLLSDVQQRIMETLIERLEGYGCIHELLNIVLKTTTEIERKRDHGCAEAAVITVASPERAL
jgi:hypothetical protein